MKPVRAAMAVAVSPRLAAGGPRKRRHAPRSIGRRWTIHLPEGCTEGRATQPASPAATERESGFERSASTAAMAGVRGTSRPTWALERQGLRHFFRCSPQQMQEFEQPEPYDRLPAQGFLQNLLRQPLAEGQHSLSHSFFPHLWALTGGDREQAEPGDIARSSSPRASGRNIISTLGCPARDAHHGSQSECSHTTPRAEGARGIAHHPLLPYGEHGSPPPPRHAHLWQRVNGVDVGTGLTGWRCEKSVSWTRRATPSPRGAVALPLVASFYDYTPPSLRNKKMRAVHRNRSAGSPRQATRARSGTKCGPAWMAWMPGRRLPR